MNTYDILNGKIFVLRLSNNPELACTYNIDTDTINNILQNTISIHRNKSTNTLYTINGLNFLIRSLNNNILDRNLRIQWQDYINKAILVTDGKLIIHNLDIYKIVTVK